MSLKFFITKTCHVFFKSRIVFFLTLILLTVLARVFFTTLAAPGDLDTTFNGIGKVTTTFGSSSHDVANAIVIQPDGKIVAAGTPLFPLLLSATLRLRDITQMVRLTLRLAQAE
jgi:hypothetical protein